MTPAHALLAGLIDYAGLFPPASLPMPEAVRNYAAYTRGPHAWILGRFLLPAARAAEFLDVRSSLPAGTPPRRLTLLGSPGEIADALAARSLAPDTLEAVEYRPVSPGSLEAAARQIPPGLPAYFEIPLAPDPAPAIAAIARLRSVCDVRAKVRTGGITPDTIPGIEDLVRFLSACARERVPFKATAGLHHPLRGPHLLTPAPHAPSAVMHGFLNVFLAAALLAAGAEESAAIATLALTPTPQAANPFRLSDNAIAWNHHSLSTAQIMTARERFAHSFGSCSFTEPIEDLQSLGWL